MDSSKSKDCGYVALLLCELIFDGSPWISTIGRPFLRTSFANELIASVSTGPRFILTDGFHSCHPLVLVTSITAVAHSVIHPMNIFDMFNKFDFTKSCSWVP